MTLITLRSERVNAAAVGLTALINAVLPSYTS